MELILRRICLFLVLAVLPVYAQDPMRDVGPALCKISPAEQTLTARFITKLNGDNINVVYGCYLNETTMMLEYVDCNFTIITDSNNETFLEVVHMMDLSVPRDSDINACGARKSSETANGQTVDIFQFHLALRRQAGFHSAVGRDYNYTCLTNESVNTNVINQIEVNPIDPVEVEVENPVFSMQILRFGDGNGGALEETSTCKLGQPIRVQITMSTQTQAGLYPTGFITHSLKVADSSESPNQFSLTNSIGCMQIPNILQLQGPFVRSSGANTGTITYVSGEMECFRFRTSNRLYFEAYVDPVCFHPPQDPAFPECEDYCAFNGRRKRQTSQEFEPQYVHAEVEIEIEEANNDQQGFVLKDVLIGVSAGLGVVLIALIIVMIFFCNRRRRRSEERDSDSYASSNRKLPIKY